ncbi:uncharacterized protein BDZ99DRAFT_189500 [Mytilinidion resinicola]|uniref:Uncharacterized protein n=1 Tax=Mytilinidion resinicola TaxID=574789 RepID=A0A6A6Z1M4_9PEZI|nr:uncharacterized protein BDZ99DRAFT_189500 [Mytilinidion resinicola]KAF2815056.1 hypothetical protein BDZ99DRAFT_189500 [Mytilinidion resinicola]
MRFDTLTRETLTTLRSRFSDTANMRRSRLTSWLENMKTATKSMAQSIDKTGRDETFAAVEEHAHSIHHDSTLDTDDVLTRKDTHNLFDKHFSFRRRRRLSPIFPSSTSKRSSVVSQDPSPSQPATTNPSTSDAESTTTTPRTSISTAPRRPSFPCVCRMPTCPLCQADSDTDSSATKSPGSVKAGRRAAQLAQLKACALNDPDAFHISITKTATGFSVARDYTKDVEREQARRDLTPRTAKFYESIQKVRCSSWPQTEHEAPARFQNVDYKAAKVKARERSLSQKARWRRESELTWYLADMDEYDEGVAPEHVISVPKRQGRAVSVEEMLAAEKELGYDEFGKPADEAKVEKKTAYEYDIFKDEKERGFLGDEPL